MSHLNLPERALQPPEPRYDPMPRITRMVEAQTRVMEAVLNGSDADFWVDSREPIQDAVRDALRDGCNAELFRLRVIAAVAGEALPYATACAVDID